MQKTALIPTLLGETYTLKSTHGIICDVYLVKQVGVYKELVSVERCSL